MKQKFQVLKNNYLNILIFLPIIIRALTKLNFEIFFQNIFSIFLSLQVFLSFLIASIGFRYFLKLNTNLSFTYVLFLLFNFGFAILFAVLNLQIEFVYFVLTSFLFFNTLFFIFEKSKILKLFQLFNVLVLFCINQFELVKKYVYDRFEIAGDVYNFIVPNVEKIFNFNLLYVFKNPVYDYGFFHINYSLLGNFYFAYLNKLHNFFNEFIVTSYIPYTLFLLSLLFIFELNITFKNKLSLALLHILILIINDWIRYQFIDSYLLEGVSCLFFAIIFFGLFDINSNKIFQANLIYFFIGFFIFSKFFINLFLIFFVISKKKRFDFKKLSFAFGLICYLYIFYTFPPQNARELLTGFNLQNVLDILTYWSEDRLLIYLIGFTLFFVFFKLYKNHPLSLEIKYILLLNSINLLLIFFLYTFIWANGVEYESSYRYFLQLYFLNIFLFVEIIPQSSSKYLDVKKEN